MRRPGNTWRPHPGPGLAFPCTAPGSGATATDRRPAAQQPQGIAGGNGSATADRGSGPVPNRGAGSPLCRGYETPVSAGASGDKGRPGPGPTQQRGKAAGRRPPPSRGTPRPLTWSGCWSFRRIPSRPWCGPPAPRLPICPGPAGPAGRRASVLWPGLSRAALLVCPLHLGVGPINGDQADCVGRPPPGSTRRPGERLVFRLGEIDDDALVSLFDCQPNPPPVCAGFVPILARGGPCGGGRKCADFSLYTYHIPLRGTFRQD